MLFYLSFEWRFYQINLFVLSLFFCILQCSDDVLMHNSEDWVQQQNNFRDNYFSGKKQQQLTENCDGGGGSVDRPIHNHNITIKLSKDS